MGVVFFLVLRVDQVAADFVLDGVRHLAVVHAGF